MRSLCGHLQTSAFKHPHQSPARAATLAFWQAVTYHASKATKAIGHLLRLMLEQQTEATCQAADSGRQAMITQALSIKAVKRLASQQVSQDAGLLTECAGRFDERLLTGMINVSFFRAGRLVGLFCVSHFIRPRSGDQKSTDRPRDHPSLPPGRLSAVTGGTCQRSSSCKCE